MFGVLDKYHNNGIFEFKDTNPLGDVCNAPTNRSGVYIVIAFKGGKQELIYIGRSGEKDKETGIIVHRKAGLGGIKDRIVNGYQFGKVARKKSWPLEMKKNDLDYLAVLWYDTENDDPVAVGHQLLVEYEKEFGHLPAWNMIK